MTLQQFQEVIQTLAIVEAEHKVRKAKIEADTAELILTATERAVERARQEDSILNLKGNLQS